MRVIPYLFISFLLLLPTLLKSQQQGEMVRKEQIQKIRNWTEQAKYWTSRDLDSSLHYAKNARQLATDIDDKKGRIESLTLLGVGFTALKEYDRAMEVFEDVKEMTMELEEVDLSTEILIANSIGALYIETGDLPMALHYHEKALKFSQLLKDPKKTSSTLVCLGKVYRKQGRDTLALTTQLEALEIRKAAGLTEEISDCFIEIGLVYEQLGDFEKAFSYFNQALELEEKKGSEKKVVQILNTLAAAYAKTMDAHNSIDNSEHALQLATTNDDYAAASDACKNLAACYKALKHFEKSLEYENLADTYKNKLLDLERKRLVSTMQSNFDLTKKETENKYLRAKKKMLERDVKRQMATIAFFCLALFLALALAVALYGFNKSRKKTNDLLQEQNAAIQEQKQELEKAMEQLKAAQSQLVQSEKMASLGQLTAGVAHEINNPVNFIYAGVAGLKKNVTALMEIVDGYDSIVHKEEFDSKIQRIQVLKEEIDYAEVRADIAGLIESIEEGAERTGAIVQGLRTFSRMDESGLQQTNVHQNFDTTLVILKNEIGTLTIQKNYDPQLTTIDSYNGQLNQVFMNILTNAIQAIDGEDGTITITTKAIEDRVKIQISDTGKGMNEATKARLFEPFYTTKEVGKGTGLGLSISYGIIKKHNGTIEVKSELGKGTTFTIELPMKQTVLNAE